MAIPFYRGELIITFLKSALISGSCTNLGQKVGFIPLRRWGSYVPHTIYYFTTPANYNVLYVKYAAGYPILVMVMVRLGNHLMV